MLGGRILGSKVFHITTFQFSIISYHCDYSQKPLYPHNIVLMEYAIGWYYALFITLDTIKYPFKKTSNMTNVTVLLPQTITTPDMKILKEKLENVVNYMMDYMVEYLNS